MLEDFNPEITHIAGVDNEDADTLSRYPMSDKDVSDISTGEALLNYPTNVNQFPVEYDTIHQAQEADDEVLGLLEDKDLYLEVSSLYAGVSEETSGGLFYLIH